MGNEGSKGKKPEDELFDAAFEMKMQAKQLEKEAAKISAQEGREKQKIAAVSLLCLIHNSGTKKRKYRICKGLC